MVEILQIGSVIGLMGLACLLLRALLDEEFPRASSQVRLIVRVGLVVLLLIVGIGMIVLVLVAAGPMSPYHGNPADWPPDYDPIQW